MVVRGRCLKRKTEKIIKEKVHSIISLRYNYISGLWQIKYNFFAHFKYVFIFFLDADYN